MWRAVSACSHRLPLCADKTHLRQSWHQRLVDLCCLITLLLLYFPAAGHGLAAGHLSLYTLSSLHSRYPLGFCIEVPVILSDLSLRGVSALPFHSRTIRLFRALSPVSASGHVLFLTLIRLGRVDARELLTSKQRGLLKSSHRSSSENASSGLYAKATLNESAKML